MTKQLRLGSLPSGGICIMDTAEKILYKLVSVEVKKAK